MIHRRYKHPEVLAYVRQNPGCSVAEIAQAVFQPPMMMRDKTAKQYTNIALTHLREQGLVEREHIVKPNYTLYRYRVKDEA